MRKTKNSEIFDSFAEDLLAERGVRPLLIVGASKVDHLLLEILRSYFLPKIAKDQMSCLKGILP